MNHPMVFVTGLAATTPLGDAVVSCAAARSGLSRPASLDQDVFDLQEGPTPIIGHPVPTVAGFQGEARLLALALPALTNLLDVAPLDRCGDVGFFVALPDLQARAHLARTKVSPSFGLLGRLAQMTKLSAPSQLQRAFPFGPVGFAVAVQTAIDLLISGQIRACVVGGIDTLCDSLALDALATQRRLKSGDDPAGLQPGEAACFLLLESPNGVHGHAVGAYTAVVGTGFARDPHRGDDLSCGEGMATAIANLATKSGPLPSGETWFVLDQNGEATRAQDWGSCQVRLGATMPGIVHAPHWSLAANFGDTGAASAALGAQMVIRSFSRGYAPGRCAVVLACSDDGERAALRMEGTS